MSYQNNVKNGFEKQKMPPVIEELNQKKGNVFLK
jgi:hypothetical protein